MKLDALLATFASEVETAQPRLQEKLEILRTISADDEKFSSALDEYCGQFERMGQAADILGFPGLQSICNHIVENSFLLTMLEPSRRQEVFVFLTACPQAMLDYLKQLENNSKATELINLLRFAPRPMPIHKALRTSYQLGEMSIRVTQLAGDDDENKHPTLARKEDIAMTAGEEIHPSLMETFLQEAPEQTKALNAILQKIKSGDIESEDLVTAKREAHTLKGTGAVVGVPGIAKISAYMEEILEFYVENEQAIVPGIAETLIDASNCLDNAVKFVSGKAEEPKNALMISQHLLDILQRIGRNEDMSEDIKRIL